MPSPVGAAGAAMNWAITLASSTGSSPWMEWPPFSKRRTVAAGSVASSRACKIGGRCRRHS
eukprot:92426-Prymnesium_polylepis.1